MGKARIITLKNWQKNEFSLHSEPQAFIRQPSSGKDSSTKYLGKIKGLTNDKGDYACIFEGHSSCLSGPPFQKLELIKSIQDFDQSVSDVTYLLARKYAERYADSARMDFVDCTLDKDSIDEKKTGELEKLLE